jgi:hypothetical protein
VHLFQLYPQLLAKLVTKWATPHRRRTLMAKGQMRSNKEKKKPKAEWNKKKKGGSAPTAYASQYASGQSKPEQSPFAKKG